MTADSYTGEENDPLSLHLYTYCENDGVNMVDPSGHWGTSIHTKLTRLIAEEVGFQKVDARVIAQGCQFGDTRKMPSTWNKGITVRLKGYKDKVTITNSMFKMASGKKRKGKKERKMFKYPGLVSTKRKYKINIQTPTNSLYKKIKKKNRISLAGDFDWEDYPKALFISGIWLHGLQDRWAHRTFEERKKYGFKHPDHTDDYMYDYNLRKKKFTRVPIRISVGKIKKLSTPKIENGLKKNRRLWNTIRDTKNYIEGMRINLERQNIGGFAKGMNSKRLYKEVIKNLKNDFEL